MPGINIVRGENGVGKTTVLEFASLIGHVALMQQSETRDDEGVDVGISLNENDLKFLKYVVDNINNIFEENTSDQECKALCEALTFVGVDKDGLEKIDLTVNEFTVRFQFVDLQSNHLKDVLSRDKKIGKFIRVHGNIGNIIGLKVLNCWARPFCKAADDASPGPWTVTPRTIRAYGSFDRLGETLTSKNKVDQPACGAVFYINTDMYEFGAGLDVRESPKELKEHLSTTLVSRLQLLRPTEKSVKAGVNYDSQITLGIKRDIENFKEIQNLWIDVFGDHHPLGRFKGFKKDDSCPAKWEWDIEIATRKAAQFVSSGENQALFILALLSNVATRGSCVLIDEPELHLTFSAGTRLVESIFKLSSQEGKPYQVIIVTHLPHLHRDRVAELEKDSTRWLRNKINFIYLSADASRGVCPLYGSEGVDGAARSSQDDVVMIARGLALEKEISIFFGITSLWNWLGKFLSRCWHTLSKSPKQAMADPIIE